MLTEVTVSLPPFIGELAYAVPPSLISQVEAATVAIGAVDASQPNRISSLSDLLLRTESVASSKIENIDASTEEFAKATAGIRTNEAAVAMVAAGRALAQMIDAASAGIIELNALLDAHRMLMSEDPFDGPNAGHLRQQQNWIGGSDYSPLNADYVPPPPELVPEYMTDLLQFANRSDIASIPQAAIVHAQFEMIHPFTDGNGRIGRALIHAVLRRRGIAKNVVVPIASALVVGRERYFSQLDAYKAGNVDGFVRELAVGAEVSARMAADSAARLSELPDYWKSIARPSNAGPVAQIINVLTSTPIFSADEMSAVTGAPTSSTYLAIETLAASGIIHQVTNRKRNRVWAATEVLAELDRLNLRIAQEMRAHDRVRNDSGAN